LEHPLVIAAGGTGGHIFPALAIAEQLKIKTGWDIAFIGTLDRMEAKIIPEAGFTFYGYKMLGLQRTVSINNLVLPFNLVNNIFKIRSNLKQWDTRLVLGMAAYVSVAPVLAARGLKIPTVIAEQDRFPGIATKLLSSKAQRIYCAYDEAVNRIKIDDKSKVLVTGNPLRKSIFNYDKQPARELFNIPADRKVILILGGSLGAASINHTMGELVSEVPADVHLIWQTGSKHYKEIKAKYHYPNVTIVPFIEQMGAAYRVADLVICRAGAITIAEITALGCPSILIPYPYATADHQTINANALQDAKAAIVIKDDERLLVNLKPILQNLINNSKQLNIMSANATKLGKPNATDIIANDILTLINP
jgi:UDP-N-acetylglucosamine--N-acetylmuramyl-(pentapeptide) pyrophosphoryl-undecaprenol N-acetylglucosamine transferase